MSKLAIVTDTDASLPHELAAQHGILQVPISILFGEESFDTGININDAQLMERINRENKLPTTAAPSPGKFSDVFAQAFTAGADSLICFCVSSKVSAAYQSAQTARQLHPDKDITVVDSNSLSIGQGYMALTAAQAAHDGASAQEAIAAALSVRERTHLFAALATLKHLAMSGRVGYLAAGMASLLNVKPILTIRDGKLDLLERVRTQKRAWARLIELAVSAAQGKRIEHLAMVHVNALSAAREFHIQLNQAIECPAVVTYAELTPGLSVHTGGGVVGVGFVVSE